MKRYLALLLAPVAIATVMLISAPLKSFTPEFTAQNRDHWPAGATIVWHINPNTSTAKISGDPVPAITTSFAAWQNLPNTSLAIARGADTQNPPGNDGVNLVCFVCTSNNFNDVGNLAVTITTTNNAGQILDADILFNPAISYTTAEGGASGTESLQTVATHEIGHLLGLDHSGVVRAVMFPFAPQFLTTLSYDDLAGISSTYPGPQAIPTGTITGTVRFATGGPVFGAHVFAESTSANLAFPANFRKSAISALTRPDGTYQITGVPAGDTYVVTAEPLDLPAQNSNFDWASVFGQMSLQTNFTTRQH